MSEEVIKIKKTRTVKKLTFFTTVDANASQMSALISKKKQENDLNAEALSTVNVNLWDYIFNRGVEAYAIKGNNNEVVEILEIIDGSYCRRKPLTNVYELISEDEMPNVVKGKMYTQKTPGAAAFSINKIETFISQATLYSGSSAYSNVFQTDDSEMDYNVDISLFRSIDTLDTLSVKNNPLSEYPKQSSETGIVTGTLYALQKIVDENGEKIKIPLSNVPVVVFNASEEFPSVSSTDDLGNRITLNLVENSNGNEYADIDSFVLDVGKEKASKQFGIELPERFNGIKPLLKSVNTLRVPEQYKYSTFTNEKGEFILHDIPTGNRILMFEVDLLKQGMTKDEVALNFFPYSTEEEPNVDSVPHYFFRQIPIGVTPSWGDFQTGYTQVNITANIDMKRWGTFFISPISFGGKNMDELTSSGRLDPLTVLARDMTREGYPLTSQVVEIQDVYERDFSQRKNWFNEISFKKPKIEFRTNKYQVFKLPANLYDPNGYSSSSPTRKGLRSSKGVWLCAYQMKMFYAGSQNVYRTTGFVRNKLNDSAKSSNHFDLNRGEGFGVDSVTGEVEGFSLNKFPYEKPWTINYPEPYSIPGEPSEPNQSNNFSSQVEPRFLDGDMAGLFTQDEEPRGYGAMQSLEDYELIHNAFAETVTKYRVYKYETNVSWHEEYSNGFRKELHKDLFAGKNFEIKNGEKYQRVEAGFCYWLRPEGWGRIKHNGWGDHMLSSDINSSFPPPPNLVPSNYIQTMFRQGETLTIKMDTTISPNWLEQGALDIYRVIDDSPDNLQEARPPLTKKAVILYLPNVLRNNEKTGGQELKLKFGSQKDEMTVASAAQVDIRNNGSIAVKVSVDGLTKQIKPGQKVTFDIFTGTSIKLESNSELNIEENYYAKCNYTFDFKTSEITKAGEIWSGYNNLNVTAGSFLQPPAFYAISKIVDCDGNVKLNSDGTLDKCKNNFTKDGDYDVNGIVFAKARNSDVFIRFSQTQSTPHCSDGGFGIRKISPYN